MEYSENRLADYREDLSIGRGAMDVPFLLLTLLLLAIGVLMVLSSSFARAYYSDASNHNATYYFTRQLFFAAVGIFAMIVASRFPIGFYRRMSTVIMLFAVGLLLLVLIGGKKVNGARRWFEMFGVTFQPSEIAKIAVILFDARLVVRYKEKMGTFRYGVLPFAAVACVIVGLLVLEPHLSASIIILSITASIMFIGGTRLVWFFAGGGAVALGGLLAVNVLDYSSERINRRERQELVLVICLQSFTSTKGRSTQLLRSRLLHSGLSGITWV